MNLNFFNTTLILAIGGLLARATDIIKIIQSILGLYKKTNSKIEVYKIESSNLNRTSNSRFGFSYIEPRTWDRFDPDNGDGHKYTHPNKPDVLFSVSGTHNVFNERDISATIESHLEALKSEKKFKLMLSRPSGSYSYDFPDENTVRTEEISAWRLKYKLKEKLSGKLLTVLEFRCNYDEICFTLYFQSNSKGFNDFEDFFLYIISEFRILGKESAPNARTQN